MPSLFADSYAFIAFLEGNARYGMLFRKGGLVTKTIDIQEVLTVLLQRVDEQEAMGFARSMFGLVVDVPAETALEAALFKRRMAERRRDCSHIDAWGYTSARALKRKFLTRDTPFKGLPNVEFVR